MTSQDYSGKGRSYDGLDLAALASGLKRIDRKMGGIERRLNEQYRLLREILEQVGKEEEAGWYDPYDNGNGDL